MSGTLEKPTGGLPQCPGFLRENLKAFLDGELSPLRRAFARWHITRCAHCREEAAWMRRLGEDMRTLEKSAPNPNLRLRILASLPPPVPMRQPMKIWRPERAAFRYGPSLALGAAVGAFALGGSFAALSRPAPQHKNSPAAITPAPVEIAENTSVKEAKTNSVPTAVDPFALRPAVTDDPTSLKANALYRETAHRLALRRRQEARLAAGQAPAKVADAAPPLFTLTPNPDAANLPELRKRLEALAIQAGGEMKIVSTRQANSLRVMPNVPLDSTPHYRPASPAQDQAETQPPANEETEADATQMALRIPQNQWQPFLQAMRTLGTLKRAPMETKTKTKNAESLISRIETGAPDQSVARDTQPADTEKFVSFRLRFQPAK